MGLSGVTSTGSRLIGKGVRLMTTPSKPSYNDVFLSYVDKSPGNGPNGDCHIWTGFVDPKGYGRYMSKRAHRVAYSLFMGAIPESLFVLHRCDNRKCVNPDHLFTGNNRDNMLDCLQKNRHANKLKTHCPRGHSYAENCRINRRGGRICRECDKIFSANYHQKIRLRAPAH